jgi:alcohol dehydrogenase
MKPIDYHIPTRVCFGNRPLERLKEIVGGEKPKQTLLVTGSGVGWKKKIVESIKEITPGRLKIFSRVEADPSTETVDQAAQELEECDLIMALGGGSVIDAAKAIAVMPANGGRCIEYLAGKKIRKPGVPVIAIPTTAGTGSEVTRISVLSDRDSMIKKSLKDDILYPKHAIVAPSMTYSMPPELTAQTGCDALSHALEALTSNNATALSDPYCYEAAGLILSNLQKAYDNPGDEAARTRMMMASLMAGFAITQAGTGLAHGLAYSLWKMYGIHHGLACAIAMPHVMRYNMLHCQGKYDRLAQYAGMDNTHQLIEAVEKLNQKIGIPENLKGYGIIDDDMDAVIHLGTSGSAKNNCRPIDPATFKKTLDEIIG